MLRKDVKSQLFSTGMLISLLLGLVLLVEPQYQYFLYFARWDNKADYINFFFSSLALGGYLIFTPIITVMPGVFRFCDEYNSGYLRFMLVRSKSRRKYIFSRLFSNAVCGGAAPFRNGGEARYVDTLAYALYRREVYDRVGLYDERLRRTEDNDMHYRMRKAGYRFFFSPDIVSWHAARKTLRGQLSQKWGNGYWIGRTMRIQPRCFAPRHLVPALFVLALIVLALLCPLSPLPLTAMLLLYGALDVLYAAKAALEAPCGKLLTFICLPFLFPVVHIVYGTGTLCGLLTGKAESHA